MPQTDPILFGYGATVVGEYLAVPQECDPLPVVLALSKLASSSPEVVLWRQLRAVIRWTSSRVDAPAEFRRYIKPAGGLFESGAWTIHLNTDLFDIDPGLLAHECGHLYQYAYQVGFQFDWLGQGLWLAGWLWHRGDVELFATLVGRVLMQRAGIPCTPPPMGFESWMNTVKALRTE